MGFNNKEDITEWAMVQINKYGIRHPDTFTENEIAYACPEIPMQVIKNHVHHCDIEEYEMDDGA
jgi:hypothetical protein